MYNKENSRIEAIEAFMEKFSVDFSLKMQEMREFQDRTGKQIKEMQTETAKQIAGLQKAQALTNKQIGGMNNSQGTATTELFYNSLKYGDKKMFGEKFDLVIKEESRKSNVGFEDEYDVMMFNGQAVCIVEVKYKADSNDVKQVLRKEKTFRVNYPEHKDKRLYLAVASRSFHHLTEKACSDNGIAIIKLVGDTVVVDYKNLKVF